MIFSAARQDKMEAVTARTKVPHACSNRECAEAVKYLILAVKPQYFDAVFSEIRDVVTPEQVVISVLYRGGKGNHPGHLFLLRKGGIGGRTAYGCSWLRQRQFAGFCVHVH